MISLDALDDAIKQQRAALDMLIELRSQMVGDPRVVSLQTKNYNGYELGHCLNGMLKKWDANDPKWVVEEGLDKQAKQFNTTKEHIINLIRTGPKMMRERFERYPQSGYTTVKDEDAPF